MKTWLVAALVAFTTPAFAQELGKAGQAVPSIPFESVSNLLKLPPDMHLGEAAGVAVNSKGHVFVFSRGGSSVGPAYGNTAAQILEFGADGQYIREIGKNLYAWSFAHTVRIDRDDNIWATDKGSDMVIKFNPEGRVTMVFGRKQEASDEPTPWHRSQVYKHDDGRFRQPTDVTWDPAGNSYVSDGYVNARIAKFDKDGNWVKSWGEKGKGPGQFDLVHSIAADAQGNIYVGDRGNARIQVFDGTGKVLRVMKIDVTAPPGSKALIGNTPTPNSSGGYGNVQTQAPGAPWALCITPGPNQVLYSSDAFPGRIYKLSLDGKVLGMLGGGGRIQGKFGWIHEIACPNENTLYVGELLNWRVQKLTLHPTPQQRADAK